MRCSGGGATALYICGGGFYTGQYNIVHVNAERKDCHESHSYR